MRWIILLVGAVLLLFVFRSCTHKISVPSGAIVFLGDSITAGYGLDPAQAYPSLIAIPGMTAVNLGISGSKTDDGLQRLKDYFASNAAPRLVVIALGANDILQGVSSDVTAANLQAAIQECKTRHIPVLLCGIRIPGKFGIDDLYDKVAADNHVPLLRDLMQGEQFHEDLLQEDHMHPTAEGQQIIAQKMQATLLQYFSFKR